MQCHNIHREPFEWIGWILHKFIAHSSFLCGPTAWIPHFVKIFPYTSLHVWCLHRGTNVHCCSKSYVTVPRKLFICVSAEMGMSVLSHCCGEKQNLIIHILFGCSLLTFLRCKCLVVVLGSINDSLGGGLYFASLSECHRGITGTCSSPV